MQGIVVIKPDDQTRGVDAVGLGAVGSQGIVEGRVGAVAIEKAVEFVVGGGVRPDDLAMVVDAECTRAVGDIGIVEGGVSIDRHVVALLSRAASRRRVTPRYPTPSDHSCAPRGAHNRFAHHALSHRGWRALSP